MTKILTPTGAPVRRITVDLDVRGNLTVQAVDLSKALTVDRFNKHSAVPMHPFEALQLLNGAMHAVILQIGQQTHAQVLAWVTTTPKEGTDVSGKEKTASDNNI